MLIGKTHLYAYWKNIVSTSFKRHRLAQVLKLLRLDTSKKLRILEIGCGDGKDVIQFLSDEEKYELYGLDIRESHIRQNNFTFCLCDAESIPFEDNILTWC